MRKAQEARTREGGRQLRELTIGTTRVKLELRVATCEGGGVLTTASLGVAAKSRLGDAAEKLHMLQASAREHVEATAATDQMAPETMEELVSGECVRLLGQRWWDGLSAQRQHELSHVYVATCNAHRWVNVAKGCDEGMKAVLKELKAEARARAGATEVAGGEGGGAPWDRLIYEVAKLVCMNARKMNVAIGQDLLGYQMIELGKHAESCLHLNIKVRISKGKWVTASLGAGPEKVLL